MSKAQFVEPKENSMTKFKYNLYKSYTSVKNRGLNIKRFLNSIQQGFWKEIKKINWKLIFTDASFWIIESFIIGLPSNYVTYHFLTLKFNISMILAHGAMLKLLFFIGF